MKFSIIKSELRLTLIIFFFGVCWIVFTDMLLEEIADGRWNEKFKYGEIFKGILFVTLMSLGLFILLRNHDKKIKANLNSFLGLFKDNPNAMWIYNTNTLQFLAVNEAAVAKYGYSEEEFLKLKLSDISINYEQDKLINSETSNNPLFFDSGVWQLKKKDNTNLYVRQLSHSINYNNQKCNLTLTEDLTNVINQGKKLRNIAFKNSHELRKPVANIIGLIQVLDKQNLSKENAEIIQYIEKSTQELDDIILSIAQESSEEN